MEHLVLLGAPASRDRKTLQMARSVVAGRCINAYSSADWLLSLSFRCAFARISILSVVHVVFTWKRASRHGELHPHVWLRADFVSDLCVVCRTKIGQGVLKSVLGLGPTDFPGFEDLDCSGLVRSHGDWCKHSAQVLQGLGLERTDAAA